MERYNWDTVPVEAFNASITRQVIHTPAMTIMRIAFKSGGISPLHHHVHEQVSMVVSGKVRFQLDREETILHEGEVLRFPPNVPHAAEALEDSILIDVFSPARTG